MLLTVFLAVVLVGVAALVWFHGLWGNFLTLINLVFAALVATVFYEPLTTKVVEQMPSYTYLLDFLILWLVFAVTFGILRLFTDLLAPRRLAFHPQVELIGRSILALLIGYLMMCFTAMSLHTAPIQARPFNGAWQSPTDPSFLGMRPDAQWMNFVRGQSKLGLKGNTVFDEGGTFVTRHAARREAFEKIDTFRVK
jgi:hypothetical protein